jgi:hypothetical protein
MDRTKLFVVAGGAVLAASPASAFAKERKRGDGYKTIPYYPYDAHPYYDPIKELKAQYIDERIWPAVQAINRSGWVWTAESCQGHKKGWSFVPMIRLVCRDRDKGDMLAALLSSVPKPNRIGLGEGRLELRRHSIPPSGWFEIRAFVLRGGVPVFERFAERIA